MNTSTIVIAWVTWDNRPFVSSRFTPRASVWKHNATWVDVEKAKQHAEQNMDTWLGYRVYQFSPNQDFLRLAKELVMLETELPTSSFPSCVE